MAYIHSAATPRDVPQSAEPAKRSLIGRLLEAIERANTRHAEREIAYYLRRSGGKFTDETERSIERYLLNT
jgi:hypothetical protein